MNFESTEKTVFRPEQSSQDLLTQICREGARKMLATALEAEVQTYLDAHQNCLDENGRRLVVRNGYLPERDIQTGLGPIKVQQPRVADKRQNKRGTDEKFTSKVLPPYLRRAKQVEDLIPWLYLKGISTGDFPEALQALLGPQAKGLSANTVTRLKASWHKDYESWMKRSLVNKRYVYFWVDGIYFNVRLEEERTCMLVVMGATATGQKELIAVHDGYRESEQSWKEILLDLKERGLKKGPELAIGDGALGFWAALPKVFSKCLKQRCWVHKTANVLNRFPKSKQASVKSKLHEVWMAETRKDAEKAFDAFVKTYEDKYPGAVECLLKDRDALLTFYDFPAKHWSHLRTTNPIESTFATVRLRTHKTKGMGTRLSTLTMVFKLAEAAQKRWRKLNGHELIEKIIQGVKFKDGVEMKAA